MSYLTRICLFLSAVSLFTPNASEAQNPNALYFHEGFNEGGIPVGWSQVRLSGTQALWSVVGIGSNPTVAPYEGTGQAKFNSFDAASGEMARLTSPSINLLSASDPFLTFAMYHEDEYLSTLDSLYIEVSTTDSVTGPWTTLLGVRRPKTQNAWSKEIVSLYEYRGASRLFVSLRGISKYGNNLYVDEFRVADSAFHDIGVAALFPSNIPIDGQSTFKLSNNAGRTQQHKTDKMHQPTEFQTPIVSIPHAPQIEIGVVTTNSGTFSESAYSVAWRVDGQSQPPFNGGTLAPRTGRDSLTLIWTNPIPGLHTVTAWTILPSDSNRNNDTARATFQVLEAGTVYYESFNGTSFPPAGWELINRDGGVLTPWFRGADTSVFVPLEGSGFAANNFQRASGTYLDDYLITPAISGVAPPGMADSLVFWVRSQYNLPPYTNFPDSLMVLVSTTGIDTSNFSTLLDYFAVPKSGWTRNAYSLTGKVPANSTVRIAFRYLLFDVQPNSGSGDFVGIDGVQILRGLPVSVESKLPSPKSFALEQNYPNPFNPSTLITYRIAVTSASRSEVDAVTLKVFDVLGREVRTLVNEVRHPGEYAVQFDGADMPSGMYFYRLQAGSFIETKRMLLLK